MLKRVKYYIKIKNLIIKNFPKDISHKLIKLL